jgi:hypothetical protein
MAKGLREVELIGESASPEWRKSSSSGLTGCVEVAFVGDAVLIRDSKDSSGPQLKFTKREWSAFVHAIRQGDLSDEATVVLCPHCGK